MQDKGAERPSRVESIDIFRGLNVLLMIFVDNLGFVAGLPWWTNHMPREANGMTYVDMVFPAFLFLMGMSIPLALDQRMARQRSKARLWGHVLLRSLTLVALGLFISNAPQVDAKHTGSTSETWTILGFLSIFLACAHYPEGRGKSTFYRLLRIVGGVLFFGLMTIFRRVTADGRVAWLDFSDWEILGLLGWAYLLVTGLYLLFRKRLAPLIVALVVLVTINTISVAGRLAWMNHWPPIAKPFEAGLSSITLAGLLTALIFLDDKFAPTFREKTRWALTSAAVFFGGAFALRPFGISKIRDTPSWCLYCISANILIFWLLYWVADKNGNSRWAWFAKPIGSNALLAYFLPYVAYLTSAGWHLTAGGTSGWYGVIRAALFTSFIWAVVMILSQFRFKLQL